MRVKSYYGNTIREALDRARRELGADASILASRQADTGGRYEVVCGVPDDKTEPPPEAKPVQEPEKTPATRVIGRFRAALVRAPADESSRVKAMLLANGFGEDLTADIVAGVRQRQRQSGRKGAQSITTDDALAAEFTNRLRIAPQLGRPGASRRIVALVGPPGVGKTTTLVKLAVRYGLSGPGPLRIVSTDSYRVGGIDALRAYASGMAADFHSAATPAALAHILEECRGKGLTLIDTSGLGACDKPSDLAGFLSRHMETDVHLVLPATMSAAALSETCSRFRPFLPAKFLVTSADDGAACLPVVAQALLHDTPLSFIGTGQMIPEDLAEASVERLCGTKQRTEQSKAISAA